MKKLIITTGLLLLSLFGYTQDLSGDWSGKLMISEQRSIPFAFHLKFISGSYQTIVDIPSKGISGMIAKDTELHSDSLRIDLTNVGMKYEGIINLNKTEINGKMKIGPNAFDLNISKGLIAEVKRIKRFQEPVEPIPYKKEEITFTNKKDHITLAGTLTLPKLTSQFPVAILISGSGPQDRDVTGAGHKPFLVLADHLTRKGIAVLRFDDRGFGKSTGDHGMATTGDFANDVLSAIEYLKSRPDIDINQIGLIGHSEGGSIAPLAANKDKNIKFIVSMAGTGISGLELIVRQVKNFRQFPVPDEEAFEKMVRDAIAIASSNKDIVTVKEILMKHYQANMTPILSPVAVPDELLNDVFESEVGQMTNPWYRYFYSYNPADEFEKINCPVLSINGSKDVQVEPKINQGGIRTALRKAKNKDVTIIELEGLNHLFQKCTTCAIDEYKDLEETFSPEALSLISNWILERVSIKK